MLNFGDYKKIIDISPTISEKSAIFPGDVPFSRQESISCQKGDHLTLSSITSTLHMGAHADAPSHFHRNGQSIDERNLIFYCGPCQVIDLSAIQPHQILPEHIKQKKISCERILFKTQSFKDFDTWQNEFSALSPQLIFYLAEKKVITVGIDTPSVDPADSKSLDTHQAIFKTNMANLEGLDLKNAEEGEYFLIAFPLKIKDGDASPVRAVLLE